MEVIGFLVGMALVAAVIALAFRMKPRWDNDSVIPPSSLECQGAHTSLRNENNNSHVQATTDQTLNGPDAGAAPLLPTDRSRIQRVADKMSHLLTTSFSISLFNKMFDKLPLKESWDRADAMSRWLALGLIVLMKCSFTKKWRDVFPEAIRSELFVVTRYFMISLWNIPDSVRDKLQLFMNRDVEKVLDSLIEIDDLTELNEWLKRYTQRTFGFSPPWKINEKAFGLDEWLSSESRVRAIHSTMAQLFLQAAAGLMDVVLAEEKRIEGGEKPFPQPRTDLPASLGVGRGLPPASADQLADSLAQIISSFFSEEFYFSVFVSAARVEDRFPLDWSQDDALSRWYALGLICLTHCSMTDQWSEALSVQGGMKVHDATLKALWDRWLLSDEMQARVREFMQANITDITSSLRTIVNRQAQDRWFTKYAWRMVRGVNAQWSISKMEINHPPLCDAFDVEFGESLRKVFKEASVSVFELLETSIVKNPASENQISTGSASQKEGDHLSLWVSKGMNDGPILDLYPTDNQIKELWQAWEQSGEEGLTEVFRMRSGENQ